MSGRRRRKVVRPKQRDLEDEKILRRKKIAILLCLEGWGQEDVARQLGVSQATVSREREEAEKYVECHFTGDEEEEREIRRLILRQEDVKRAVANLTMVLGIPAPEVLVPLSASPYQADSDQLDTDVATWDRAVREWGRFVAGHVAKLLATAKVVGCAWGRTCRSVIDALHELPTDERPPLNASGGQAVIPLWPPRLIMERQSSDSDVFSDHSRLSSNSLAHDLCGFLNGNGNRTIAEGGYDLDQYLLPGIDLIPFTSETGRFEDDLQPSSASASESAEGELDWDHEAKYLEQFRAAMSFSPAYCRVFGTDPNQGSSMVDNMDACLMSCGPPGTPRSFGPSDNYGGVPQEWLKQFTLGDVGGVILGRAAVERLDGRCDEGVEFRTKFREQCRFDRLARHWLGVSEEVLAKVAEKARSQKGRKPRPPGCIVLALGPGRSDTVMEILLRSMCNHLLIDHTLANSLARKANVILRACVRNALHRETRKHEVDKGLFERVEDTFVHTPDATREDFEVDDLGRLEGLFGQGSELASWLTRMNRSILEEGRGMMKMRASGDDSRFHGEMNWDEKHWRGR